MKAAAGTSKRTTATDFNAPLALMQSGDFDNAAELFRQQIRRHPDAVLAHAGLGRCAARLGRRVEAVAALRQAARLAARGLGSGFPAAAALDIVFELHAVHAHAESLPLIDAVLSADRSLARAHHMKAQVLERMARPDDARASAARALALAPGEPNAHLLLAALEARCGATGDARARLEAMLPGVAEAARPRIMQELARVLECIGEYDAAFETMHEANARLLAQAVARGFDRTWLFDALERERACCSSTWMNTHGYRAHDGRADPIFLVGFYRSGTTLLDQMLASHPRIVSTGETALLGPVLRELERLSGRAGAHWTERWVAAGADVGQRLRDVYFSRAADALGPLPRGKVLLDKTTLNSIHLGIIRALFPQALIVFAHRDPRDVLISAFMQSFEPTPLTQLLLDWKLAARFLDAVLRHRTAMRHTLLVPTHDIRYEALVTDARSALKPVLDAAGVDWDDAVLDFHQHAPLRPISTPSFADVSKPLHPNALGRWRRHASRFDVVSDALSPHVDGVT